MKKKIFLIPTAVAAMSLVACGNKPKYNITFESKTLSISSTSLQEGKDFSATVKMNSGLISKYDMPTTLGNIQVQGGEDIKYTDYTYEINEDLESAKLVIPGKFITNNLKIVTEAKLVEHELVFLKSDAFEPVKPKVGKNESLDTYIYVKSEWMGYVDLPSELEITISEKPLQKKQYTYRIVEENRTAYLHIDKSLITDDIIVNSQVTPSVYNVSFENPYTCKLTIDKVEATVATAFTATISATDEGYILPKTLTIKCTDALTDISYEIPRNKGFDYSSKTGNLTIYSSYVFGDITIYAEALSDWRLTVDSSEDDTELMFYKDANYDNNIEKNAEVAITESDISGGYLSLYVKTKDPTNKPDYIVPSTFDITINGEKVVGYTVTYGGIPSPVKDDTRYATIKIQSDCVKGRLHVYGVAQEKNKNVIKATTIYLNTTGLPEYITEPQELSCTFSPKSSHELPLAENVNININGTWYDGNGYDELAQKKEGISYDSSTGTLTISQSVVEEANPGSDIIIIAKPADVSVLKELTTGENTNWETLHALSMYGYNLFTPGETTGDFYLDGIDYPFQARLIGFKQERGSTDTGYVQGLTLEFTTSISQQQYYQTKTDNNTYYQKGTTTFESNLYKYLNDPSSGIINKLPSELKANLYQVTKYGLTSDGSNKINSLNYLYPLSLGEMNEGLINLSLNTKYLNESADKNNPVYHYYKQFTTADELKAARIKGYGQSTASAYWLRTPDLEADNKDFNIMNNGATTTNTQTTKGVAPAFCI